MIGLLVDVVVFFIELVDIVVTFFSWKERKK